MLHGSLGTARIAVRRNALAGEGSRKLHGLLDNFKNFSRNCQAGPVDTPGRHQKVFELCCPSVQFPPGPCPACVCGERLSERYRELLCGSFQRATVRAWPSLCATGKPQTAHRRRNWAPLDCGFRPALRQ
jgi:hypothetical protein